MNLFARTADNRKKTLIIVYIEFASRRAHRNNHAKRVGAVDARRDFFLAHVICHLRNTNELERGEP